MGEGGLQWCSPRISHPSKPTSPMLPGVGMHVLVLVAQRPYGKILGELHIISLQERSTLLEVQVGEDTMLLGSTRVIM